MATNVQTNFTASGATNVANQIRGIGASASFANGLVVRLTGNLNGLIIGAGIVKAIEKFIELGNSFTQVQNKLAVFSSSQAEATEKLSQLALVAVKNRVELDAVSLTYQRLAQQQEHLKLTNQDLIGITDTLTKSVALSGSSTAEATSGLRQFTQALGSDFHAAAQEINSILKETPGIALALARGLGVGVGELKRLGQAGVLNSQLVIDALKRAAPQIDVLFSKTQGNAGQGFTNLATGLEVLVGRLNQVSGAGNALFQFLTGIAQKMIELANDTDKLNGILETTKSVLTEIAVLTLAVSLGAVETAFVKIGEGALFVARAITTGFGGPIFIIGTLFSVLFALRSETVKIGNTNVTVGALIKEAFIEVKEKIFGATKSVTGLFDQFKSFRTFLNTFIASLITLAEVFGKGLELMLDNFLAFRSNLVDSFLAIPRILKIAVTKGPAEALKALTDVFHGHDAEMHNIGEELADALTVGFVSRAKTDFVGKIANAIVPEGFAKRAAARAASEKIAEPTLPAVPPINPVSLPDTFSKNEKAITKLVASFDAAIKVQLQFAEAQETIRVAIKDKTISALDGATIAADFARSQFDKLAVSTDAGAKLTAEHAEKLVILSETARRAGISATELGAAQARENFEFDHAIVKIKTVQQSMDALTATTKGIAEGFHEFGDSLGTMFSQISDGVKKTMDDALGAIDTFVQKGTFNFNEFTLQILGDISKIITRLIAIQTINAFKNTVSEGGGIGGFLGRVLGSKQERSPVPGANLPPGASPETQAIVARLTAISTATAEAGPINHQLLTANTHLSSMDAQLGAIVAGFQGAAGKAAATGPTAGPAAGGSTGRGAGAKAAGFGALSALQSANSGDTFGAVSSGLGAFQNLLPFLGFAGGGDVEAGRPVQVGERGREVFVPRSNGTIVPHDKTGGAPQKAPVVNVVNVDDPSSVLNAVKTREGEQLIINAVMRNRGRLREVFG